MIAGFAGSTADALTLFERLEAKLEKHAGNLQRAAVELAKDWRSDKFLRRLEALMAVADKKHSFIISGTGDVLGLPFFVSDSVHIIKEVEDGAAAVAGTLVGGVSSAATATTGDVRGTYEPDTVCDGSTAFELIVASSDPKYLGVAQYAG